MRWVLIRPCNQSPYYDPEIQEPLGLEYLSAFARRRGDQVLVLDAALDGHSDIRLARRAVSFQPDGIGISMTTAQEMESVLSIHREASRILRGRHPYWLAGGNFVTSEPAQAQRLLPTDFTLVRFEGENALEEMAQRWLSSGRESPDINSTGRTGMPRLIEGPPVADLDKLPFPDRPYADNVLAANWAFNLQGSRGCFGACRYCSSPAMTGLGGQRWRGRSIPHVVEEISQLHQRYGTQSVNFIDEDFLGPNRLAVARANAFASSICQRGLRIAFSIQVRPDSLTDSVIDTLAEAGLTYLFMGVESVDPDDLRRWGRPLKTEPWPLIQRLQAKGVEVNVGVMMWHPDATFAGIRRCADELRRHGLLEYRSAINRLDAMPGSVMHAEALAAGRIPAGTCGPQSLPFLHDGIQELHLDVLSAVSPLGPPSMHALCALPPLLAQTRLAGQALDTLGRLRNIIHRQNDAVVETFFAMLDSHEAGLCSAKIVERHRLQNLAVATATAENLVKLRLAPSVDALREAIRLDAGI